MDERGRGERQCKLKSTNESMNQWNLRFQELCSLRSSDASPGRALRPETEIIYERRSRQSETRIKNNVRRDRERESERGKSPNAPNAPHFRSKEGFYRRGEEKTRTIAVIRFFFPLPFTLWSFWKFQLLRRREKQSKCWRVGRPPFIPLKVR